MCVNTGKRLLNLILSESAGKSKKEEQEVKSFVAVFHHCEAELIQRGAKLILALDL